MNKQITEDYVSYEVAKLLKEKGFGVPVQRVYSNKGSIYETYCEHNNQYKYYDWLYPCATLQMALKWLREVHKLHIKVGYDIQLKWYYDIISLKETASFDYEEMKCYHNDFDFDSYEEAVEASILDVLKNLI